MEQVVIFLYQAKADFQRLFKVNGEKPNPVVTVDTVIVSKIDDKKVSDLITLCNNEQLPMEFGQFGIVIRHTTIEEEKKSKNKK